MPIVSTELESQYWEPVGNGPAALADLSAWAGLSASGPPAATIAASSSYQSGVIPSNGFKAIGIGVTSSQAGTITIQRYLDAAGLVPVGAAITASITATTAQWATVNDGTPFRSFKFSVSNSGTSAANITNFGCLLSAS
jgi:hypothetical protein